jgi:hypothetical protein
MLTFLHRWFWPDPRQIFTYNDGKDRRRGDPLAIGSKLEECCPQWEDLLRTLAAPDTPMPGPLLTQQRAEKTRATAELVKATRETFGVKPLTESDGLTIAETVGLLAKYLEFMGGLSSLASPTSAWQAVESPSLPGSITGSSAGSGGEKIPSGENSKAAGATS